MATESIRNFGVLADRAKTSALDYYIKHKIKAENSGDKKMLGRLGRMEKKLPASDWGPDQNYKTKSPTSERTKAIEENIRLKKLLAQYENVYNRGLFDSNGIKLKYLMGKMKLYSYTGLFSATVSDRQFADGEAEQPKKNFWQKHKDKILGAAALAGLGGLGYAYRNELGQAWNSAVGKANEVKKQAQEMSAASAAIQEWDGMVNALTTQNSDEAFLAALNKGQSVAAFGNNLTGHQVGLCKNIIKKLEAAYQRLVDSKGKIGGWWMAMNHESDLKALSLKFDQIGGERTAWQGGRAS